MNTKERLSNHEIASFCSQTALLFQAGITPLESIALLQKDTKNPQAQQILDTVLAQLDAGENFHTALSAADIFPDYMLNMIRLGEASGNLDEVIQSLADYYEREEEIASSIKSAVTYPFIMIAMMVLILFVLISKVIPIFNQVFVQLGSELTGFSHSLLVLGQALNHYAVAVIAILVVLALLFVIAFKTRPGRKKTSAFFSSFPLTSGFFEKIAAGRFASGMALALGSGLDAFSSLSLTKELITHPGMLKKIDQCREALDLGETFGDALVDAEIFSNLYARMVTVGFKTGSTDKVMKKIAASYDNEVDRRIQSVISVIEPTLVIVLSVIVGVILLSVILPLMGVMSSIG